MYDYQIQTLDEGDQGRLTIVPRWLRSILGEDFFSDVHKLGIGGGNGGIEPPDGWKAPLDARAVSESKCRQALEIAAPLDQIRSLAIHDAVVRRDALDQLTCWGGLIDLRIDGCDVRDEDLAPLARAVNLRAAWLNREPIGDEALVYLRSCGRLRTLALGVTNVTDKGLSELARFPELRELWLFHDAGITDLGIVHVARCPKLRFLELSSTNVGDEGVKALAQLAELRYLNLCKTWVTDEGVKHLAPLANLEEGLFFGTAVTQAGVDQIPSLVKSKSYLLGKRAAPQVTPASTTAP